MTSSFKKTKLEGPALKAKVDELIAKGVGFSACCKETGYSNITKTGTEIPAASQFSRALLDATGYVFPAGRSGAGGGRARDGKIRVMGGGNAIVSKGYLRDAGIQPGDELKIDLKDDGSIVLSIDISAGGGAGSPAMNLETTTREDSFSDTDWENTNQLKF